MKADISSFRYFDILESTPYKMAMTQKSIRNYGGLIVGPIYISRCGTEIAMTIGLYAR